MTRFKEFLNEYWRAPIGASMTPDQLKGLLSDAKLTPLELVIPNKKDIKSFSLIMGSDEFIILTDRIDTDDIVGYMWLKIIDDKRQVQDVCIFNQYQNHGLAKSFYIKLVKELGYTLLNGFSLSQYAEKLWLSLPKYVTVKVFDKQTGEISEYDDRPSHDDNRDPGKQRYFWIALPEGSLYPRFTEAFKLEYDWKGKTDKQVFEELSGLPERELHLQSYRMRLEGSSHILTRYLRTEHYGEEGEY